MHEDNEGQEGEVEHEPDVDVLEVGGAGQGGTRLRVEGHEHKHRRQAHGPALVEHVHWQVECPVPVNTGKRL